MHVLKWNIGRNGVCGYSYLYFMNIVFMPLGIEFCLKIIKIERAKWWILEEKLWISITAKSGDTFIPFPPFLMVMVNHVTERELHALHTYSYRGTYFRPLVYIPHYIRWWLQ